MQETNNEQWEQPAGHHLSEILIRAGRGEMKFGFERLPCDAQEEKRTTAVKAPAPHTPSRLTWSGGPPARTSTTHMRTTSWMLLSACAIALRATQAHGDKAIDLPCALWRQ